MVLRVAFSVSVMVLSSSAQTTWHVDVNATPPGNGTPQSPYASIQYAISRPTTASGDRILVAPGTYNEAIDYLGKTLVVRGVAGAASTVLDGFGLDTTVVSIHSGEGPGTRLEGFHVTRAGSVTQTHLVGGGLLCSASTAEIRECRFTECGLYPARVWSGAAAAVVGGSLTLVRCRIFGNSSQWVGGAVYASNADLRIDQCTVKFCASSTGDGGGAAALGSQVEILRSSFSACSVDDGHGGALFLDGSTARIADSSFVDNRAELDHNAGAIRSLATTLRVERCRFEANRAAAGGAISMSGGAVLDCQFIRNQAGLHTIFSGSGSAIIGGSTQIERCLFWGNTTSTSFNYPTGAILGGVLDRCTIFDNSTSPPLDGSAATNATLRNCIVWGNSPAANPLGTSTATYCDVDVPIAGTGNLSIDPLFVAPAAGDLRLAPGSPCIDAGDPASPPDPDGSRADMGAVPFHATYGPAPVVECEGKINSQGCVPYMGHNAAPASVTGGLFVVHGRNERANTYGLLVWSLQSASIPFQGGVLCVGSPRWRTPLQSSGSVVAGADCPGEFSFAWTAQYLATTGLAPGTGVHCQFWGRDALDAHGSSLTDALAFQLVP